MFKIRKLKPCTMDQVRVLFSHQLLVDSLFKRGRLRVILVGAPSHKARLRMSVPETSDFRYSCPTAFS